MAYPYTRSRARSEVPAYNVELSQSVPLSRERAATSQRVVSQRAPSLSPSQSTFSYGAPSPPIGSDIGEEYPAARPSVFQPSLVDTSVDRARPVAAGADVSRMSLPHASVDVGGPRPVVVAHRGRLDVAYARAYGMTSSRITPKPGLALSSVTDDASFAYTCALGYSYAVKRCRSAYAY